jgi:hypothetical protein
MVLCWCNALLIPATSSQMLTCHGAWISKHTVQHTLRATFPKVSLRLSATQTVPHTPTLHAYRRMFHICGMGPHPRQRVWHTFGVGWGGGGVAGFGGLQVPKLLGVTVIEISNVDSHCVLWSFLWLVYGTTPDTDTNRVSQHAGQQAYRQGSIECSITYTYKPSNCYAVQVTQPLQIADNRLSAAHHQHTK